MELIDRRKLVSDFWQGVEDGDICSFDDTDNLMENAPTVDAVEVVHGQWLPTSDDNKKRCSRCDIVHLIAQYPHGQANYCPNCGAKMYK